MKKAQCMFCDSPATLLCDGLLGFDAPVDENGVMTAAPKKLHTCDAPLCRSCATWHGNIFFSGRHAGMDTRDYCPICQKVDAEGRSTSPTGMTDERAQVIRLALWATHENPGQRKLTSTPGGGQLRLDF